MKILKMLVTPALMLAFAAPVFAADPAATPGIDQRIQNQERRIEQGEKSGTLTGRESARLERKEQRIENMEEKAKADGKVTPQERRKMDHQLDRQSKRIHREKHDRQHL
jgi:septal ring factor EnvC (AmiA/AmiB activator)